MPEERHMVFDYPPADPEMPKAENDELCRARLHAFKRWLKGKRISGRMIEENGVVTFVYIKKEAAVK